MDDLIYRQAAIDAIENAFDRETILNRFVRKIAISAVRLLPSAQPEKRTDKRTETHACDLISRQAAIATAVKAAIDWHRLANPQYSIAYCIGEAMRELPSAQPEHDCDTCRYNHLEWDEEPCDGCTVGGESCHWKPSAQPEIIRCKDCKHYVIHTFFGRSQGWCERLCDEFDKSLARGTESDDYCSRAERRKDG